MGAITRGPGRQPPVLCIVLVVGVWHAFLAHACRRRPCSPIPHTTDGETSHGAIVSGDALLHLKLGMVDIGGLVLPVPPGLVGLPAAAGACTCRVAPDRGGCRAGNRNLPPPCTTCAPGTS